MADAEKVLVIGSNSFSGASFIDYLLRLDDMVTCSSCRTRFEVPSHQSLVYLHELEGLPKDVEEEE